MNLDATAHAVISNIHQRRSVSPSKMKADPLPVELLETLFEAANWAPSHKHTEPWRFQVFIGDGRQKMSQAIGSAYKAFCGENFQEKKYQKLTQRVLHVPVTIALVMEPSQAPVMPEWEEVAAVACAVQNMHLAAHAMGVGLFWTSPKFMNHELFHTFLGLSSHQKVLGLLYLGYPEEGCELRSVRKSVDAKITWVKS